MDHGGIADRRLQLTMGADEMNNIQCRGCRQWVTEVNTDKLCKKCTRKVDTGKLEITFSTEEVERFQLTKEEAEYLLNALKEHRYWKRQREKERRKKQMGPTCWICSSPITPEEEENMDTCHACAKRYELGT